MAPSCYVLSYSIMDAELVRVQMEEIRDLKGRKRLMLLLDSWEDLLKCFLYEVLAAGVNHYPTKLCLEDMAGH